MFGILDTNTKRSSNISNLHFTFALNKRSFKDSHQDAATSTGNSTYQSSLSDLYGTPAKPKRVTLPITKIQEKLFIENESLRVEKDTSTSYGPKQPIYQTLSQNDFSPANLQTNSGSPEKAADSADLIAVILMCLIAIAGFPWLFFTFVGSIFLLVLVFSFTSLTAFWLFSFVFISGSFFCFILALIVFLRQIFPKV